MDGSTMAMKMSHGIAALPEPFREAAIACRAVERERAARLRQARFLSMEEVEEVLSVEAMHRLDAAAPGSPEQAAAFARLRLLADRRAERELARHGPDMF